MQPFHDALPRSRRGLVRDWLAASLVASGYWATRSSRRRAASLLGPLQRQTPAEIATVSHKKIEIDGSGVFYRETGPKDAPTILLLHGFPNSSFMFRNLMATLGRSYHLVAPDLPGFGFSDVPERSRFAYTFDHLTDVVEKFTDALALERYSIYGRPSAMANL